MKKTAIVLLSLFFIFACNAADKDSGKDTLVFAHKGEMQSLDPVYPYDAVSQGLILNVYDTLIKFKGSSLDEFEPLISENVPAVSDGTISKDGKTYIFKIRKGVKFHNGYELTPEDVKYSLLRFMLTDRAGGPSSLLLEPVFGVSSTRGPRGFTITDAEIENAVRVDGDKVIVTLKKPFAPFLSIIARWSYVMSKKWCAETGQWDGGIKTWKKFNNPDKNASYLFDHMNGTGPFELARWDIPAKSLRLKANEKYFLGAAKIKNIHMITVEEMSTMRLMLESGEADIAEISVKFATPMKGQKGIVVADNLPRLRTDPVLFFTLDINTKANPDVGSGKLDGKGVPHDFFADIDLRKAFAHSFDYDSFLEQSMEGKAVLARGPVPEGLLGYDKNAPAYEFDLKKAEEYFKKAWNGQVWEKGFRFTMTYSGDMRQIAGEVLKRNVEKINPKFRIDLRGVPWAAFLEKTDKRQMPVWIRGWIADYADAHNFMFPFLHSRGRYAISQGFKDATLDALIERAVTETNVKKRTALYNEIQEAAHAQAVQIYTVHPSGLWAYRDRVKGFYDNPVFMGIYFYPLYK